MSLFSCSKNDTDILPESEFDQNQLGIISYFKSIALGFEFGNASAVTRKWNSNMRIYVGGDSIPELHRELDDIIIEINDLVTDGFEIQLVTDSTLSNYHIFFGSGAEFAQMYPNTEQYVGSNWGLFFVNWDSNNNLYKGYMYVDTQRADLAGQKHLLREELTQSLGLARDSSRYPESIFQSSWTTITEYAEIDMELIRLLYHPRMQSGLNIGAVDVLIREIFKAEAS